MTTSPAMTESQLQDKIRLALGRVDGLLLFRNNIGVAEIRDYRVRFGVGGPGGSDLVGHYKGHAKYVEVKTEDGRQSPEQKLFEQLVIRTGAEYVILRSVDEALAWAGALKGRHG